MKKTLFAALLLAAATPSFTQTGTIQWTRQLSGASSQENIWNFTYDADGNIYGITDGYGAQTFMDTTFGSGYNTTLFKLNPAGDKIWANCISNSEAGSVAVDDAHNGYFGGWFDGTSTTIGPYTINATPGKTGSSSYYATFGSSGAFTSATKIYSGNYYLNMITRVICNGAGNVAYIDNREALVGGSYTQYHTLTKKNVGGTSWTKAFTSTDVTPMHIDASNNLYISGNYYTTIVINGTTLTNSGETDSYIAKLNSGGTYQWIKKIGGRKSDFVSDITSDGSGNCYVSGYFTSDTLNIDGFTLYGDTLHHNTFLIKINSGGTVQWAISFGGSSTTFSSSLYFDAGVSRLYLLGLYLGDITIGPDVLLNTAIRDYYIAEIDLSGTLLGGQSFSYPVAPVVNKYKLTSPETAVLSGSFTGTVTIGDATLVASGTYDGFISYVSFSCTETVSYADSDGDGYGNAAVSVTDCTVPDGYVLNADDCNDANGSVHPGGTEICNSIDDDCDGSIDENLITATITPGGPTTFCQGGSVVLSANAGAGLTYQWKKNGTNVSGATNVNYNANKAGNYTVLVTIPGGCNDLSDIVAVVVNSLPAATITNLDGTNDLCIDPSIQLKANSGVGYTYQWYKGASALAGATSQFYSATSTGNFKVKVTNPSGCSKTSAAYTIVHLCRLGDEPGKEITIFPNPNNGIFTISVNAIESNSNAIVTIFNSVGEEIAGVQTDIRNGELNIDLGNNLSAGIYFIKIKSGDFEYSGTVIVEK